MKYIALSLLVLLTGILTVAFTTSALDVYREIPLTTEKSLRVKVNGSFESIYIRKGAPDKVVTISRKSERDEDEGVYIDYSIIKNIGYLEIDLNLDEERKDNHKHSKVMAKAKKSEGNEDDWYISLPATVPIDLDLEFGVGKVDVDLTELQISHLSLEAGASKVFLKSDTKNPLCPERVSIEAGLGKFSSRQLGNLNFKKLNFEGGIGSYKIDLGGALREDARVNVEVGMGSVTMVLPKSVAARLHFEDHWFNSSSFPKFFKLKDGVYETKNVRSSKKCVMIKAECGVGSMRVKWD